MDKSNYKKATLQYNQEAHTVTLDINSTEVIPAYLRYLLISYGIPSNVFIEFKDMTAVITKKDDEYEYERIDE